MTVKNERKQVPANAGFTLIEVLLVVAILGILAGVAAVSFGGKGKGARIKATRATIHNVSTAIDMYEVDTGRYPSSLQGLISSDGAANWSGPYLRGGAAPTDAWGTPLTYSTQDSGYKVVSAGPDLATGSSDDITSFEM